MTFQPQYNYGVGSDTGQHGCPCMAPFVTLAVRDVIIVVGDKGSVPVGTVGTAVPINTGESRLGGGEQPGRETRAPELDSRDSQGESGDSQDSQERDGVTG